LTSNLKIVGCYRFWIEDFNEMQNWNYSINFNKTHLFGIDSFEKGEAAFEGGV